MKIKYLIPIIFFMVTWNEMALFSRPLETDSVYVLDIHHHFVVGVSTLAIKLATQKDVDLFLGNNRLPGHQSIDTPGIISPNAFNIKVEEAKE